jgi:hypothetical protein
VAVARPILPLAIAVVAAACGVSPQPPTASPTTPPASAPPASTPAATAAPSPRVACGRIDAVPCADAVAAARAFAPDAFVTAVLVIVDSECPPGTFCVFNAGSVVVVIPGAPGTTEPWRAFVGRPNQPVFELSYPDLPRHILELLPAEARPS